jgi:hypothetical protein
MLIAALLISADLQNNRTDQQVIDRYKQMLRGLRQKGTQ